MAQPDDRGTAARGQSLFRGSILSLAQRWSTRLIGIVNTVILARILAPDDFGLVAMAVTAYGLLEVASNLDAPVLVIRDQNATPAHYDTAWTLQLLQGGLIGAVLLLAAPLAAGYFDEPRLVPVLYAFAGLAVIEGMRSISMALILKERQFGKDFQLMLSRRLIEFAITVPLAFWLRSYWAIVVGFLCGATFQCVLSYLVYSYWPRPRLTKAREYLPAGFSILVGNIGHYVNQRLEVIVVGGFASASGLGAYNLAADLGRIATTEVVASLNRPLFPTYAELAADLQRRATLLCVSLGAVLTLCMAFGIGMALVASDFVHVVLGEKWTVAIPLLQWLAIAALLTTVFGYTASNILVLPGGERHRQRLYLARFVVLAPVVIVASRVGGLVEVAMAATFVSALFVPISLVVLARIFGVPLARILAVLWRPVVAAAVMAAAILSIPVAELSHATRLILHVGAGGAVYATVILVLWRLAGMPEGIEKALVTRLAARFRTGVT